MAHVEVVHPGGGEIHILESRDLGRGGVFLNAADADTYPDLHVGAAIDLAFFSGRSLEAVHVNGLVVRVQRGSPGGFAVAFTGMAAEDGRRLDEMIAKSKKAAA